MTKTKTKAFTLDVDDRGVGTLIFDLPGEKVNKFSPEVLEEFSQVIDDLSTRSNLQALVIKSGKPDIFVAGADITVLETIHDFEKGLESSRVGHEIFDKLEQLPFPTIALIDGACLGGGLELALACTYRVVTNNPKTKLGLPEVNLGIIPGWGGTQRLPRLAGLMNSLPLILGGKPVDSRKAYKLKIADAVVNREFIDEQFATFLAQCLDSQGEAKLKARRKRSGFLSCLMEGNPFGRSYVFKRARDDLERKTHGHYPAPVAALELIETTVSSGKRDGMRQEQRTFADLAKSAISKNLIKIFFTTEALKKDAGVARKNAQATIKRVGVLGGGVMGGGIAWLMSKGDIPVRIKDVNWDGVAKGFEQASKIYDKLQKIRKIQPHEAKLKMHHISGGLDYTGFHQHDLIVEAIVENIDLKKKVLGELEENVREDAIICSNTSTFSITEMAKALKKPDRFCGMHFFNPVNRMPLVEIIPGKETSQDTVNAAVALMQQLGKTPVVVQDCPGFLVNRVLFPYLNEAQHLVREGVDFEYVDKVIEDFGMPMGPYVLSDEVGLDTAVKAAKSLEAAYGERAKTLDVVQILVDEGLLGKKTGRGFFVHEGKKRSRNPEVDQLLHLDKSQQFRPSVQDVVDRMILPMVNEASRCLEEKIVEKPSYLDMAMIMGTGFPPFRGGPLRYADSLDLKRVVEKLDALTERYGVRFEPSDYLRSLAKAGKCFYDNEG